MKDNSKNAESAIFKDESKKDSIKTAIAIYTMRGSIKYPMV